MKLKIKRPPIYGNKSLRLAFEFGLVLSETAKDMGKEITPEISAKAEYIFIQELRSNGANKTALNFIPLLLSVFEL
jgi:hypothetical protein